MGKVRSDVVKRIARELVERFSDKFTTDFESNKKILDSLIKIQSQRLRNQVAGYITRLIVLTRKAEGAEAREEV